MIRLICVTLCAISIIAAVGARLYGYALLAGIAAGTLLFVISALRGGMLGNTRNFGQASKDVAARIGISLAAAGIASASLGHEPPYPLSFRIFYGLCMAGGCVTAVVLAFRDRKSAS